MHLILKRSIVQIQNKQKLTNRMHICWFGCISLLVPLGLWRVLLQDMRNKNIGQSGKAEGNRRQSEYDTKALLKAWMSLQCLTKFDSKRLRMKYFQR